MTDFLFTFLGGDNRIIAQKEKPNNEKDRDSQGLLDSLIYDLLLYLTANLFSVK